MPTENLSGQPLSKKNLAILDEEWKQVRWHAVATHLRKEEPH